MEKINIKKRKVALIGVLLITSGCINKAVTIREGRREIDFGFDWKFQKGDFKQAVNPQYDDSKWQQLTLPHDWSIEGPYSRDYASGTGYLPGGIAWYRKSFQIEPSLKGKIIAIEFDGIYNNSEVWINGHYLGKRPYGYSSFQYDLTEYINFAPETNVIAVRVDHSQFADSRWYTGSGIYRNVRLRITDPLHIAHWGTYITTPVIEQSRAQVKIETTVNNYYEDRRAFQLQWDIIDRKGKIVASQTTTHTLPLKVRKITWHFFIRNPQLWDIKSPYLYQLKSTIKIGGEIVDGTVTPFGIRQFRFDPDKGFFLNGKNIKIKGVCLHHDGGCVGAAVPVKLWERRLELMKQIGVNAIRTSHNPPAPEFLDLCDRMGFVVMDEAFDEFTPGKNKWIEGRNVGTASKAGFNEAFDEWAVRDIQDMVRRDRNHPSIILWSIANEVDYPNDPFSHPLLGERYEPNRPSAENLTKYGKILVEAVKELDVTRPVTAAMADVSVSNAVGFAQLFDVAGYNYQETRYAQDHNDYPSRCIIGSENSSSLSAWEAVEDNDYISGQFIWTGIDYLGEADAWPNRSWPRALCDLCGFKKPQAWFRQSIWTDEPMVYLACRGRVRTEGQESSSRRRRRAIHSNWNWTEDEQIRVYCYTNCDEVELFLNDKSLSSQTSSDARGRTLSWQVPFESGTLKAVGKRNGRVVYEYSLQTAGKAERIKLLADTKQLIADGRDIAHIEFRIVDAEGILIPDAQVPVTFEVQGPAKIIGVGNGNPNGHESHQASTHSSWQGRGLLILQSTKQPGTVTLRANAPALESDSITIKTE